MKLVDDWEYILRKAWSIRWILIAGFFAGSEAAIQIALELGWLAQVPVRPGVLTAISFFASNLAFVTRLLVQKDSDGDQK